MRCNLCVHWHHALKILKSKEGISRVCASSYKEVKADNPACVSFRLHHTLFCPWEAKMLQRDVKACLNRQKIKRCKCKLGKEIKNIIRATPVKLKRRMNHAQ